MRLLGKSRAINEALGRKVLVKVLMQMRANESVSPVGIKHTR